MAKDYTQLSKNIVKLVGTEENVASFFHCATRLRFKVKNVEKVDIDSLKQLEGVITVINSGGQIQVVIGNHVDKVYDCILQVSNISADVNSEDDETGVSSGNKRSLVNVFMETVSGIFAPMLGVMSGAGMLKALLVLFTSIGLLDASMSTYRILYAAADAIFVFLPIILGYTAGKKFGCNPFVAMTVGMALVYPDMTAAFSANEALSFLGLPVIMVNYTSSVMPIIISVYVLSKFDKLLKKFIPDVLKMFLLPLIELAVIVPATFLVIGPVMDKFGKLLAAGYTGLVGLNPIVAGGILGLIWPAAVLFGLHWGFVPIVMNNIATLGRDTLFVITGPNNMAQAGAALGVFLKTKDKKLKELSGPAALSAVLAGITEPAIYGVTLPYKRPFYIGAVFSGIAGAIVAASGASAPTLLGMSILALPGYIGKGFVGLLIACVIAYVGSAVCTYLFGFSDKMIAGEKKNDSINTKEETKSGRNIKAV